VLYQQRGCTLTLREAAVSDYSRRDANDMIITC
jgi:hypothetical protein